MIAKKKLKSIGIAVGIIMIFLVGLWLGPYVRPPVREAPEAMWEEIEERGVIKVGSSPDWPPYEYLDPETGEFTGFEVELTEKVAARLGLRIEWKSMGFETIIPSVKGETIDLGVSGFSITPERLKVIQYSVPHSITEGQIVMLKSKAEELGITEIKSVGELKALGLSCGTGTGTLQEAELSEKASGSLRSYADFSLALEDMKRGMIDSVYSETPITSWWILEAKRLGEEPLVIIYKRSYWPVAFVIHPDNDVFAAKINGALSELIAEGWVDELKTKWKC